MRELDFISAEEFDQADRTPLPNEPRTLASETAPYYLDAVRKQFAGARTQPDGLKIYTALDLEAQEAASKHLRSHLDNLEKKTNISKGLKEKGHSLEEQYPCRQ